MPERHLIRGLQAPESHAESHDNKVLGPPGQSQAREHQQTKQPVPLPDTEVLPHRPLHPHGQAEHKQELRRLAAQQVARRLGQKGAREWPAHRNAAQPYWLRRQPRVQLLE